MIVRMGANEAQIVLVKLKEYAEARARELFKKAETLSDESKKNHLGGFSQSPRDACMREASDWENDAYNAKVLASAIGTQPYKDGVEFDFEVVRWMFKHEAPEMVQSSIGRFPG